MFIVCLTRFGASAILSTLRPTICTVAPPVNKAFVVACPIPLVPPITKATLFFKFSSFVFLCLFVIN
jgi:hypothetical protein